MASVSNPLSLIMSTFLFINNEVIEIPPCTLKRSVPAVKRGRLREKKPKADVNKKIPLNKQPSLTKEVTAVMEPQPVKQSSFHQSKSIHIPPTTIQQELLEPVRKHKHRHRSRKYSEVISAVVEKAEAQQMIQIIPSWSRESLI